MLTSIATILPLDVVHVADGDGGEGHLPDGRRGRVQGHEDGFVLPSAV